MRKPVFGISDQEAVQIVREAVETRLTQALTAGKSNQSTGKGNQTAGRGNQTQSIGKSNQPSSAIITEEDLHSLSVAKEKLIIYACQRQVGSPQGMSQLVRVMGEKTNGTSKGVSISSYFQKVSSGGAKSGSSSTSTSPTPTTGAVKSGGKRNILKKIVQKSDSNVSNKRKKTSKTSSSKRESTIHQFLSKDKDSCTLGKADTASESQEIHLTEDKITDGAVHMMETDSNKLGNNALADDVGSGMSQNQEAITEISDEIQKVVTEHIPSEKEINAVRISQVFNSPVPLNTGETSAAGSVTLISVDQMHEIQQQELAVSQLGSTLSEKRSPDIDIVHDKIRYQSGSDMDESFLPSASFVSQGGSGSPVVNAEMNDKLKVGLKKVTNYLSKSPKLDVVSGIAYSPIFSRKKSENTTQENVFGDVEKFQTSDINGESDSDSNLKHSSSEIASGGKENELKGKLPSFSDSDIDRGINEPNQVNNTYKTRRGNTRLKRKLPNFSDSDGNAGVNEPGPSNKNKENISQSQTNSQENKRLKRNLPDFSDSGSDDNDLPLISRKTRPPDTDDSGLPLISRKTNPPGSDDNDLPLISRKTRPPGSDENDLPSISRKTRPPAKKKFVSLDEMNKKAKKFSISKSFFSGKDEKLQPTLSFFMSDKSQKTGSEKPTNTDSELNKEELENLDCTLIEELSSVVNVKDESDPVINREIKQLKEVDELNEEQLNFMVRTSEPYLRDIFEGKIHSSRHMAYKKGGKSKRDLNYGSCLKLYSEEQIDTVMEALMRIFCKRHHKYLDYIMKVLLPEMLIKFHMEIHSLNKEDSERKLMA